MWNLDNINTTTIPPNIIKTVSDNISEPFDEKLDREVRKACGITVKGWDVIFTNGRKQANEIIITHAVESYRIEVGIPHLIVSAAEHTSTIELLKNLKKGGLDITFVPTDLQGNVLPEMVERYIKSNTCLISIVYVQEDTGAVNNIQAIGQIARQKAIPFHTDATQYFSHVRKVDMRARKISAMSIDGGAFHAPHGVGALIVDENFIKGYNMNILRPTINTGLICGMNVAIVNPRLRGCKIEDIASMRRLIIKALHKTYNEGELNKYKRGSRHKVENTEYVLVSPEKGAVIPNIITLAIITPENNFNGEDFVEKMKKKKILLSTPSEFVMEKLGLAPSFIKACIRISTGSDTKITWIKELLKELLKVDKSTNKPININKSISANKSKNNKG